MNIKVTNGKVAITFVIGFCLIFFSGLLVKVPWLFVTSVLIGIILLSICMGYFVYHLLFFILDKMNGR